MRIDSLGAVAIWLFPVLGVLGLLVFAPLLLLEAAVCIVVWIGVCYLLVEKVFR